MGAHIQQPDHPQCKKDQRFIWREHKQANPKCVSICKTPVTAGQALSGLRSRAPKRSITLSAQLCPLDTLGGPSHSRREARAEAEQARHIL